MATTTLPLLVIGETRGEFRELEKLFSECEVQYAANPNQAFAIMAGGYSPAVIVVEQASPGRISTSDLAALRRAAPLARVVRVLGTWMEGELRTGPPQPGTLRAYWHEATNQLLHDVQSYAAGRISRWTMPVTANDQERLLEFLNVEELDAAGGESVAARSPTKSIVIYTQHRETAESLADICAQCGWRGEWLREHQLSSPIAADAILLDSAYGVPAALKAICKLRRLIGSMPIIAVVGFARGDELADLFAAGAAICIRKPFLLDDLRFQVDRFVAKFEVK